MQIIQVTPSELKEIFNELLDTKLKEFFSSKENQQKTELLSRKETKELLGVSYVTLNNWNRKGILEPNYLGNKVFYNKQQIVNQLTKGN
ncbi:DNA-binding protein [Polaribacter atrinae]|uniref:DNA-binding protein n=1 Tax=Polaribacter atrinae TaxID=1333662 RepID=UPI0024909F6B|nr:DNA-binding protein [Polaribacter atrinae]